MVVQIKESFFMALFEIKNEKAMQLNKEKQVLKTMIDIKKKYGKNAVVRGMNLKEGATAMDRNRQIGGHKA